MFPLDWRDAIQLKMRHHALRLLGTEITDYGTDDIERREKTHVSQA